MRRPAAVLAVLAALVAAPHAHAAVQSPAPVIRQPVVAVLDSGLLASHQEFDYRGPRSTRDQIAAWWDFTAEVKGAVVLPQAGQAWDTAVRDPYDREGHGTLTASMAGGRGTDRRSTPAGLPGVTLAIGKVANGDGSLADTLATAITWATDTVRADVISISINSIVPRPASLDQDVFDALARARDRGVLVVVSNGNGLVTAGVPGNPGWATNYSASTKVLAVGASGSAGYLVSTDPEVTSLATVAGPAHTGNGAYTNRIATSFAAPYVAGFAAALIKAARSGGREISADRLEQLIKFSAQDTATPPQFEGYGVVSPAQLAAAQLHARAGTLPTRPSPDLSGAYVEQVAGTLRSAWSD